MLCGDHVSFGFFFLNWKMFLVHSKAYVTSNLSAEVAVWGIDCMGDALGDLTVCGKACLSCEFRNL